MKEKIINILNQEIKNNYKNNSVFGGLSFFIKKILDNHQLPPVFLELLDYDNLNYQNRKKLIDKIIKSIQSKLENGLIENIPNLDLDNISTLNNLVQKSIDLLKNISPNIGNLKIPIENISKDLNINKRIINQLKKTGINTLEDVIWFAPRTYSDRTKPLPLNSAVNHEKAYVLVEILSKHQVLNTNKVKIIKYNIKDGYGNLGELIFFNQEYITHYLKPGNKIKVFGKVSKNKFYQVFPEEWEYCNNKSLDFDRIVPHYSISINQKKFRDIVYRALKISYNSIHDYFHPILVNFPNKFIELSKAILNIHFPSNFEVLQLARNRLAFEEIIYTQILLNSISQKKETTYVIDKTKAHNIISELELPFELTSAQKRVIQEIIGDFCSGKVCRRLVQGDVGSGKTIVAIVACAIVSYSGYQACLMAPTEILANQHYNNFQKLLPNLNIGLLTSKVRNKKRKDLLKNLKEGKLDILIGTHAIINDNVEFKNLALVIVDEQHKFGVAQRLKLYSKSDLPHLIVMSATPIPRTLAFTVYGDLDISVIDELPPGRKKAITEIFNYKDLNKVYDFIEKQLMDGKQAYIICPSIFENPKVELKNVEKVYQEVKNRFLNHQVAYIHGKMNPSQKETIMQDFREGKYSILISTTVIEVGVDVPNSNTIVILDAERFGLSQLHQMRGRIKRSDHQPYCFLITSKNLSYGEFNKSLQRLSVLKYYDDGFKIAEKDLEFRGPGEVVGFKQHGFTDFKVLNPLKDIDLIKFSHKLSKAISNFVDQLPFVKDKINQISNGIENIADSI